MAGNAKNPVAIDTYENLYGCLDPEFFAILGVYSWFKSGLLKVEIANIPYGWVLGLKYLIDYNEASKMGLF